MERGGKETNKHINTQQLIPAVFSNDFIFKVYVHNDFILKVYVHKNMVASI